MRRSIWQSTGGVRYLGHMPPTAATARRAWVIPPRVCLALAGVYGLYLAVATYLDFHPLFYPADPLEARGNEAILLWPTLCVAVGFVRMLRGQRPPRSARWLPVMLPTLAVAVVIATRHIARGGLWWFPRDPDRWFWLTFSLVGDALPLAQWGMVTFVFAHMARLWRRPTEPGRCPACQYNLTGNTTGRCPECGQIPVWDDSIPAWFHRARFWPFPELAEFPDARARHEAWRIACRRAARHPVSPIWGLIALAGVVAVVFLQVSRGGRWIGYVVAAAVPATLIVANWYWCRLMRRYLREVLRDQAVGGEDRTTAGPALTQDADAPRPNESRDP